jgi:replicative DNA helicase
MAKSMESEKGLPVNIDAERFVLGSIMLDADLMHAARPVLAFDEFSLEKHRRIWKRACEVYDAGGTVDRITTMLALQKHGELESVDGLGYLIGLDEGLPMVTNLDAYVRAVKDKATLRRVIVASQSIIARALEGRESAEQVVDGFGKTAVDLMPRESGKGLRSAGELIDEIGVSAILSPRKDKGLMFPWSWMNAMTCGMLPAELWVLAARTSAGKTSAMLQHAVMAAQRGHSVAIFSLEVGDVALIQKAAYQIARVDSEKGKTGRLMREDRDLLAEAVAQLHDMPLYFNTQATTVMAIHAAVRQRRALTRVDHVIVDYLQLLGNTGRFGSRAEAVGANAWALKMLATDFQIPVLLLSQFKRFEKDREPELADLKESGDIENHANGIWFIHRQSDEDIERIPVKFMLPKQRDGRRNPFHEFEFHAKYQRFEERTSDDWSNQ